MSEGLSSWVSSYIDATPAGTTQLASYGGKPTAALWVAQSKPRPMGVDSLLLIVIWAIFIVWFGLNQYYEVVGLVRRSFTSSNISIHVVYSLVRSSLQSYIHTNLMFIGGVGGLTIGMLQTEIKGLSDRRVQLELLDRIEKLESTINDLEVNNKIGSN